MRWACVFAIVVPLEAATCGFKTECAPAYTFKDVLTSADEWAATATSDVVAQRHKSALAVCLVRSEPRIRVPAPPQPLALLRLLRSLKRVAMTKAHPRLSPPSHHLASQNLTVRVLSTGAWCLTARVAGARGTISLPGYPAYPSKRRVELGPSANSATPPTQPLQDLRRLRSGRSASV